MDDDVLLILDNAVVNTRWIEAALVAVEEADASAVTNSISPEILRVIELVLLVLERAVCISTALSAGRPYHHQNGVILNYPLRPTIKNASPPAGASVNAVATVTILLVPS